MARLGRRVGTERAILVSLRKEAMVTVVTISLVGEASPCIVLYVNSGILTRVHMGKGAIDGMCAGLAQKRVK